MTKSIENGDDHPFFVRLGEGVRPAAPAPCATCPWRTKNQEDPPPSYPEEWYREETRAFMWAVPGDGEFTGLCGGDGMLCHTPKSEWVDADDGSLPTITRGLECRAAKTLQQRAAIRWLLDPTERTLEVFRTPKVLRDRWSEFSEYSLRNLTPLRILADMLDVDLEQLQAWAPSNETVLAAAPPGVFDPEIASELVPAPTEGELRYWRRLAEAA